MREYRKEQIQSYWLYGKHPVMMAIENPKRVIKRTVCTLNSKNFLTEKLSPERVAKLNVEVLTPDRLDRLVGGRESVTHQGIAVEVEPLDEVEVETLGDAKLIVALDKITDPHNVGAIMRSAAAFGAAAIMTQEKNSPPENATIAKISAGTIEVVPYIRPSSLWIAIENLKKEGFRVIGLDGASNKSIADVSKHEKIILVVGSEGKGLSESIVERCDDIVRIDIAGTVESLNASVATAIALYELTSVKR